MSENKPDLSIIIPAYKEVDNLKRNVLEGIYGYLKKQKYTWEVVIVNDGSPDKTLLEVKKHIKNLSGFRVIDNPHRGKGAAVMSGVLSVNGKVILFTDMDQATPIEELGKVLPKFEEGFDVVIGSRSGRKGEPFSRQIMAYGFSVLRYIVLRLPYKDTQCGFKALTFDASRKVFNNMKLFTKDKKSTGVTAGFDLELLYLARKTHLNVAEVPVNWEHVGSVRVNPLKDSWLGLKAMIQVRLNALSGAYNLSSH